MKRLLLNLVTFGLLSLSGASTAEELIASAKEFRQYESQINAAREAAFSADLKEQQAALAEAKRLLKDEQTKADKLKAQFASNEEQLTKDSEALRLRSGSLGEMFGVVRQASSEAYGRVATSIVSAQFPGRGEFLAGMAEDSKGLPNIQELEDLWFALQKEMTEGGETVRFTTEVVNLDGGSSQQEVVRIGTFNLVGEDGYLTYDAENEIVQPLGRQPDSRFVGSADDLIAATSGMVPFYADPSQGAILGLLKQKATMSERYHAGGVVGYTITVMLAIGLLIGLYKLITLTVVAGKMRSQLKNPGNPSDGNPLGRILKVYQENKAADAETFGVIVGLKEGQLSKLTALKFKKELESEGKTVHLIALTDITNERLRNLKNIDAFIQVACPRISTDNKFDKPVLSTPQAIALMKVLRKENIESYFQIKHWL